MIALRDVVELVAAAAGLAESWSCQDRFSVTRRGPQTSRSTDFVAVMFRLNGIACRPTGLGGRIQALEEAHRLEVVQIDDQADTPATRSPLSPPAPSGRGPRRRAGARVPDAADRLRHRVAGAERRTAARAPTCRRARRSWSSPTGRSTSTSRASRCRRSSSFENGVRHRRHLQHRHQRQQRVLRQGQGPARQLRADRARHHHADRLDGRAG